MPLRPTDTNFRKVLGSLLNVGEEVRIVFGAGRRVVALTGDRLMVTTFPFFFAPKLLLDAPLTTITGLDSVQCKAMALDLVVTTSSTTLRATLPTSYGDVPASLSQVFEAIRRVNPRAGGASYFENGEEEVAALPVKGGTFKVSNQHLFVIGKRPNADGSVDIQKKVPHGHVKVFDFYQSTMNGLVLQLETAQGVEEYKVPGTAMDMHPTGTAGIFDSGWIPAVMAHALPQARPSYYRPDETPLYEMRAGTGFTGAISAGDVLRFTNHRLLHLSPQKGGLLGLSQAIERSAIRKVHVVDHKGEHGNTLYYKMTVGTDQGESQWSVLVENEEAFKRMTKDLGF